MKNIQTLQMETVFAGSNRQCLIDGILMGIAVPIGSFAGCWLGGAAALVAGFYAANSNGRFQK